MSTNKKCLESMIELLKNQVGWMSRTTWIVQDMQKQGYSPDEIREALDELMTNHARLERGFVRLNDN